MTTGEEGARASAAGLGAGVTWLILAPRGLPCQTTWGLPAERPRLERGVRKTLAPNLFFPSPRPPRFPNTKHRPAPRWELTSSLVVWLELMRYVWKPRSPTMDQTEKKHTTASSTVTESRTATGEELSPCPGLRWLEAWTGHHRHSLRPLRLSSLPW